MDSEYRNTNYSKELSGKLELRKNNWCEKNDDIGSKHSGVDRTDQ